MENKIDITKISELAKLKLTEKEALLLETDLNEIISFINKLQKLDTSQVVPSYSTNEVINKFQVEGTDKTGRLDIEHFLDNHENTQKRNIVTDKIL